MLRDVDPDQLLVACGDSPSYICRKVLEWSGDTDDAELADVLLAKPLQILVLVLAAWVVLWLSRRAIRRLVRSLASKGSVRAAARAETLGSLLRSFAALVVWTVVAISILGELGVNLAPLIASAGIAGVAIGFGAQSLVKDFLAGLFILFEDQYGVGDIIDAGELSGTAVVGTVEGLSLRATRLRSVNGTVWHVPNGTVLRVGNMSQQWARALLDITVAHGTDVDRAQTAIKEAADGLWQDPDWSGQVLEEPEVWGVEDLGLDGINIRLVVKTEPAEQFKVMRELRPRILRALGDVGVEVAQRQSTRWLSPEEG